MKHFIVIAVTAFIVSVACNAQNSNSPSKSSSDASQFAFGIGVGITPSSLESRSIFGISDNNALSSAVLPISLLFVLDINELIRLEPEFGINSQTTNQTGASSGDKSSTLQSFKAGLGVLFKSKITSSSQAIFGLRGGYLSLSQSTEASGSTPATSVSRPFITMAGVVGGEYYLARQFSLGAEINIGYISVGELTSEPASQSTTKVTGSGFFTNAQISARFYFAQ